MMTQMTWTKWLLLLVVNGLFAAVAFPLGFMVLVMLFGFMSEPDLGAQMIGVLIAAVYLAVWILANRTVLRAYDPYAPGGLWNKVSDLIGVTGVLACIGAVVYALSEGMWH